MELKPLCGPKHILLLKAQYSTFYKVGFGISNKTIYEFMPWKSNLSSRN